MSTPDEPSEQEMAEMRAAYEAQMKQITTADVVIQTAVSLINLAGRRLGLGDDTRDERDLEQVRDAIDGVRGLMPVLERRAGADLRALRDALTSLQMAYAREVQDGSPEGAQAPAAGGSVEEGDAAAATAAADKAAEPNADGSRPGPAQSSGRLWVPGS